MKSIEELDVFKISRNFVKVIYEITKEFPQDEKFGLTSQMRRAAVSVCSNLSEGGARITTGELKQFIGIARGSAAELKCQIMLASDLNFINKNMFETLTSDIERINQMLTGLLKSITK
ncbi:MAG: four helix bundle protein [Rickettsiales bacterium]|jgi:four helix bundle protein|nr:four helix bundle protein [Rickettsiales bacterium]